MILLAYHYSKYYTNIRCTYTLYDGNNIVHTTLTVDAMYEYNVGCSYTIMNQRVNGKLCQVVASLPDNSDMLSKFKTDVVATTLYKRKYMYHAITSDHGDWLDI